MLSGDELRKYLKDNGQTLQQYNDSGANTNWQKEVQRDGISHNHNLAFSGGTNKTSYGASLNYLNNQGIIKTSSLEKLILKLNLEQKFFDDRLKLSFLMANSNYTKNDVPQSALFGNMLVYMPTVTVHRPDGTYTEDFSRGGYLNPVSLIETNTDQTKGKSTLINALAEVKIIRGLQYTLSVSSQSIQNNRGLYYASNSGLALGSGVAANTGGKAYRSSYENSNKVIESYFNYDKSFGQHSLKLLAGYSWQQDKINDGFGVQTQGFTNNLLSYNNLYFGNPIQAGNIIFDNPDISTLRLISYYGRVNYQFGEKYLFQASIRNDGSSAFGENKQWGYFPAVSAGWRISKENFMNNVSFVDELKLRGGYGVSGNSLGFNAFSAVLRYGPSGSYYNNGLLLNAFAPVQNENPDLKWESTATANFGLDFSVLKGRISGAFDYYVKTTSDLIYQYPVSSSQYFVAPGAQTAVLTANVGKIRNTGVELLLNANVVTTKDFTWRSSLNLSHNKNVVVSLSNDKFSLTSVPQAFLGGKGQTGNWSEIIQQGAPIGTFNLWHYMGKDKNGVSTYLNAKDSVIAAQPLTTDFRIAGNAQPKLLFGWNNSFTYRNFDLNFFFRGVTGNKILNNTLASLNNPADAKTINMPRFTLGESFKDVNAYLLSDRYLEDGSYIRLDNATLGYTIKTNTPAISRLRVYVSANNLFTITSYRGLDPEINIGGLTPGIDNRNYYPKTRSFLFGVNMLF
jgi:iron complex outermembrane receptor protein